MMKDVKASIDHVTKSELLSNMIDVSMGAGDLTKEGILDIQNIFLRDKSSNPNDVLTEYDLKVQNYILNEINLLYPKYNIIAEEGEDPFPKNWDQGWTWCIDPIDGTLNYMLGRKEYAVSIGLLKDGKPYAGVIYSPLRQEVYYAEKGKGAFLNGNRIHVRKSPLTSRPMVQAQLNGHESDKILMNMASEFSRIQTMGGSAALDLCFVSSGQVDVQISTQLRLWDIAAGKIIVEEAGGEVLNFKGEAMDISEEKLSFVAGHSNHLDNIFVKLKDKIS